MAINAISPNQIRTDKKPGDQALASEPGKPPALSLTAASGISAYWRKNTSSIEAVELANLLRALRKVTGHLGANAGRIEYAGMSGNPENAILIDPEMVMGRYPVPEKTVDHLIGRVVHEALRRIEWSDHTWKTLEPAMEQMPPLAKVVFQKIVRMGEAIYVDQRVEDGVFGLYTQVARDKAMRYDPRAFVAHRPCVDELLLIWWAREFGAVPGPDIASEYPPLLKELKLLASSLKSVIKSPAGVTKRCEQRASLYLDAWGEIKDRMADWKIVDKHLYWIPCLKGPGISKNRTAEQKPKKQEKLNPVLIREIEANLSADAVDMTPMIRSVVGYDDETVVPVSRWDFNIPSHPVVDRKMISRLKAIFSHYADRHLIASRGLSSGRIDHRRLFRAHVTGRCFKTVESIPNMDWGVTLLIVASGSMRGNKWQMVENTVANIHKALTGYQNRLFAWAYFEVNGICMISRLIQNNRLFSIPPAGQTASGQAIIAAAKLMPANISRNLLIHITDGESNFGCDVAFGIEYCRQQKIPLITLGCGYKSKDAMKNQYGRTIQFIDYFEQLPKAMESLFKGVFLYGGGNFPKTTKTLAGQRQKNASDRRLSETSK